MKHPNMQQEIGSNGNHRLVNLETKKASHWTTYTLWAELDGYVSVTDYYISGGGIMSSSEFCKVCQGPALAIELPQVKL